MTETSPASASATPSAAAPSPSGRTCVLHIGMHKTGSSSIQHTLIRAPQSAHWALVHGGMGNSSYALHAAFGSPEHGHKVLKRIGMQPQKAAQLGQKTRRLFSETLAGPQSLFIISAEGAGRAQAEELERLRAFLSPWVERIRVVGYVRSPHEFMESSLQERIKSGHLKKPQIANAYPDYRQRLEKFDQVFGRENVEYRSFEPKRFPQSNVVLDFAEWVGIQMDAEQTVRANDSVCDPALRLLLAGNAVETPKLSPAQRFKAQRRLAKALQSLKGPKLRLAASLISPVLAAHEEDLLWMDSRLGAPLQRLRPSEPDADAGLTDLEELHHIAPEALAWLNQALEEADLPKLGRDDPPRQKIGRAMARLLVYHAAQLAKKAAKLDKTSDTTEESELAAAE